MDAPTTETKRIHLQPVGDQWVLYVDEKSIISTHDRGWLEQVAEQLQQRMSAEIPDGTAVE